MTKRRAARANGKNPKHADSTTPNSEKKARGFQPGNPYRWPPGVSGNPKGRPTKHEDLEEVIQEFFNEKVTLPDGQAVPRLYVMLRAMASSKAAYDHVALLEHGFGKVPQAVTVEDVTNRPDSELIAEFTDLVHAARARTRAGDSGGTAAAGAGSGGGE